MSPTLWPKWEVKLYSTTLPIPCITVICIIHVLFFPLPQDKQWEGWIMYSCLITPRQHALRRTQASEYDDVIWYVSGLQLIILFIVCICRLFSQLIMSIKTENSNIMLIAISSSQSWHIHIVCFVQPYVQNPNVFGLLSYDEEMQHIITLRSWNQKMFGIIAWKVTQTI